MQLASVVVVVVVAVDAIAAEQIIGTSLSYPERTGGSGYQGHNECVVYEDFKCVRS